MELMDVVDMGSVETGIDETIIPPQFVLSILPDVTDQQKPVVPHELVAV
jgi:hypothetical protein